MRLRLLTYNIHKGIGNDRNYHIGRIIQICRNMQADFIALQEVSQSAHCSHYDDMAKVIAGELHMHYQLALNVHRKKGNYGNAVFSCYPLAKTFNLDISLQLKKERGCLISYIQMPNYEVAILNLHLGLVAFERRRQLGKILDWVKGKGLDDKPIVLLGDTNDSRHKLNPLMQTYGFKDTVTNSADSKRLSYTFPSYAPILRLDKAFVSKHWVVEKHWVIRDEMTRVSSDHLPVFIELRAQPLANSENMLYASKQLAS